MCWQCDNPEKTTDDYLAEVVVPCIDRNGWYVQSVLGGKRAAPFAYTVGLTELGLPERVVTGMPHYRSAPLLSGMAVHWLHCDVAPVHGEHVDTRDGGCLEVVDVPHPDAHLHVATALFGSDGVTAQQLVWVDGRGRWPWERGHRAGRGGQPVLGPRAHRRTGVCTLLDAAAAAVGEDATTDGPALCRGDLPFPVEVVPSAQR